MEPLEYMDDPGNPTIEEGFQLHRIPTAAAKKLAAIGPDAFSNTVEAWQQGLDQYGLSISESTVALADLVDLVQTAERTGKSVFIETLFT